MTDQPQPPPYDDHPVVVQQLAVAKPAARVPRPRGLPIVVLGIVVAVLAGYIAVLLIGAHRGDVERQQLACEVQRLGGRAIGNVDCPKPTPAKQASPRPTVLRVSPTPVPVAVVSPSMLRGPAGPAGPPGPAGSPPRAAPAPSATRAPASPTARPSPTPSCRQPNPLPAGPRCVVQLRATRR